MIDKLASDAHRVYRVLPFTTFDLYVQQLRQEAPLGYLTDAIVLRDRQFDKQEETPFVIRT